MALKTRHIPQLLVFSAGWLSSAALAMLLSHLIATLVGLFPILLDMSCKGLDMSAGETNEVNRKRYAVPLDKDVPFTLDGANSRKAQEPAVIKSERWQEIFVRKQDELHSLPEMVDTQCESWCSKAKDSNLSNQVGKVQDKAPLWTVQDPPRYILHR